MAMLVYQRVCTENSRGWKIGKGNASFSSIFAFFFALLQEHTAFVKEVTEEKEAQWPQFASPPLVTLPSPGPKFLSLGTHFLVLGILYIYTYVYIYIYIYLHGTSYHISVLLFGNSRGVFVSVSPWLSSMGLVASSGGRRYTPPWNE